MAAVAPRRGGLAVLTIRRCSGMLAPREMEKRDDFMMYPTV